MRTGLEFPLPALMQRLDLLSKSGLSYLAMGRATGPRYGLVV